MAGFDVEATATPYEQMEAQLLGFPEVHWAAVAFSLVKPRNTEKQTDLDTAGLTGAMAPFFGVEDGQLCGFLATPAWQVLQKSIDWNDGTTFFAPNPGVLYPAVYDLAERVLAAAKAVRPFAQNKQEAWRDSLTGEAEWLTTDRQHLATPPGQRQDTLWSRVAKAKPSWAKEGEHLGALSAIKRLWPTIFAEEVGQALAVGEKGEKKDIGRFVVSTHTMALAHQLDQWLERGGHTVDGMGDRLQKAEAVALPRKLVRKHAANPVLADAKRIPGLLEAAARGTNNDAHDYEQVQRLVKTALGRTLDQASARLETYYALIMMDGDKMGAILSGDEKTAIPYRQSFHPQVQKGFDERAARQPLIQRYGEQKRPISPNRHLAISGALNDFSQIVVRHVVEEEHLGRVIYAGGDDVLAMLPVADLLSCMQRLRHAYSGIDPDHEGGVWQGLTLQQGFAALKKGQRLQVMRMMGEHATASCGAVIAHHQAPLSAVVRTLRDTEKRAKSEGGRDAFSITVLKRSGGALFLTAKWGEPVALLDELTAFLRGTDTSRRAVYHTLQWLRDLPEPPSNPQMLESLLAYQLARQSRGDPRAASLAQRLARLAVAQPHNGRQWLANFLTVAEFLARETRSGGQA